MGPLCPEQLTQEETLDEVCVGPSPETACRTSVTLESFQVTRSIHAQATLMLPAPDCAMSLRHGLRQRQERLIN
jgi:hypothetical protein